MASSDIWSPEEIFEITDGPSDGDFVVHASVHLRDWQRGSELRFSYNCPQGNGSGKAEVMIRVLGFRQRGRYYFQATRTGNAEGVVIGRNSRIEGWYDPATRQGYFRCIQHDGPVGSLLRKDVAADDRWERYVTPKGAKSADPLDHPAFKPG